MMKTKKTAMTIKPLFMWAGGKSKMVKHYKNLLPMNFDTYIEPFFGGGAMLLTALQINPQVKLVINDVNEGVINIYRGIQCNLPEFLDMMDNLSSQYLPKNITERKEFYYKLREEHAFDYQQYSRVQEAAILYFLMKTGFNGIWQINKNTNNRFGTPCGLLTQKTSVYDRQNVLEWHRILQDATILHGDYVAALSHITPNSWLFMDPPYRGGFTKYGTTFDDGKQREVIHAAANSPGEAWVTNRDLGDRFFEDYIEEVGYPLDIHKFNVTYTAGRRKKTAGGYEAKKAVELLIIKAP